MTHLPGLSLDLGETIEMLRDTVSGECGGTNRNPKASARCTSQIGWMLIGRVALQDVVRRRCAA